MKTKICRDCNIEKSIEQFRKNSRQCRSCEAIYKKEYYIKTRKYKLEYSKKYRNENKEYYKKYRKANKDKSKQYNIDYYIKNKNKIISNVIRYQNERIKKDNIFKLKKQLRKMIYNSFYRKRLYKNNSTRNIIGCDLKTFINYLLKTYKDNYGYEWNGIELVHIDHIKPLKLCNTEQEVIECCHYTNLQLLKAKDNLKKGDKLNWELHS